MAKGKKKQEIQDYKVQLRALRQQGPGCLYLLWGREDYLREQYLLQLKKLCIPGGEDDFSYRRFDGAELDFQALADAIDAVPFLSERTLVEVRGYDTNKCREEEADTLVRVISDLPDYCTLVFVMDTAFEPGRAPEDDQGLQKERAARAVYRAGGVCARAVGRQALCRAREKYLARGCAPAHLLYRAVS